MTSVNPKPILSIVAPCYNEEESVSEFVRRAAAAARACAGSNFEIVLVDDGSKDGTWNLIESLSLVVPQIVGVRLLRNYGHQMAATAGLTTASGERVLLIDADLQDPPELVSDMMAVMDQGADVVYGRRIRRNGETWFKRMTAAAFYRMLSQLASVQIPQDTGDFRLMNRRITDILVAMPEQHRFIRGMVSWIGGRQVALDYERDARFAGVTKYPFLKMVRFAVDALTSFSTAPLRISTYVGMGTAMVALVMLVYSLFRWVSGATIEGWASLMVALTFFSAIQLIALGVIGEYLGRMVQQGKGRPSFIIDHVMRRETALGEGIATPQKKTATAARSRSKAS